MKERNNEKGFKPITERETWLTGQIVQIAIEIHKTLGPGLMESVYKQCFYHELQKRNIPFTRKAGVRAVYDTLVIDQATKIDLLIDNLIVVEIKAEETHQAVWDAQLLTYLKLSGKRLGYILNFHVSLMKNGIKRMIYN